jgi:hypothetical protein
MTELKQRTCIKSALGWVSSHKVSPQLSLTMPKRAAYLYHHVSLAPCKVRLVTSSTRYCQYGTKGVHYHEIILGRKTASTIVLSIKGDVNHAAGVGVTKVLRFQ